MSDQKHNKGITLVDINYKQNYYKNGYHQNKATGVISVNCNVKLGISKEKSQDDGMITKHKYSVGLLGKDALVKVSGESTRIGSFRRKTTEEGDGLTSTKAAQLQKEYFF